MTILDLDQHQLETRFRVPTTFHQHTPPAPTHLGHAFSPHQYNQPSLNETPPTMVTGGGLHHQQRSAYQGQPTPPPHHIPSPVGGAGFGPNGNTPSGGSAGSAPVPRCKYIQFNPFFQIQQLIIHQAFES